ncbi:hypothetical protein EBME_0669 [bacterium endosymbiont of Mortierella elongata FMR23-6]|nr:hypothetical protein EBME_0669 [bacterium endosymbiont of Mortierella elongata FMR23-6]
MAEQTRVETVVAEVKESLASLKHAYAFIDRKRVHALTHEVDLQHETIVERIAPKRPDLALELLWLFLELAPSVYECGDDSNDILSATFHQALRELGDIAQRANAAPIALANQIFTAITADDYGQYVGITDILFPALGQQGVAHLKAKINAALALHPKRQDNQFDYQKRVFVDALKDLADQEKNADA